METKEIKTMGTSIEVLAAYLAHGVEAEMLWFPLDEDRHMLRGLDTKSAQPVLFGEPGEGKGCGLGACLPVLRSFSSLVKQLPDETVPAITVARMLINDLEGNYTYRIAPSKSETAHNFTVHVYEKDAEFGEMLLYRQSFLLDWNWLIRYRWENTVIHLENIAEAIDYLRSLHFALPVGGKPLVAGVDYIEKEG